MSIEKLFEEKVAEWKQHCEEVSLSSNPRDYLNCDAYREIITMGKEALPLIRKFYATDEDAFFPGLGWATAVREIIGKDFQIPETIRGNVKEVRDYVVKWLDKNIDRYNQ